MRQEQEGLPEAWGGAGRKSEQLVAAPPSWSQDWIPGGEGVACSPLSQTFRQRMSPLSVSLSGPFFAASLASLCPSWDRRKWAVGLVPSLWTVQLPLALALLDWDLGAGLGSALMLGRGFFAWPACLVTQPCSLLARARIRQNLPSGSCSSPATSLKHKGQVGAGVYVLAELHGPGRWSPKDEVWEGGGCWEKAGEEAEGRAPE